MGATVAAKNRAVRQEAIREQLTNGGHIQHVVDIATKLQKQHLELESSAIQALRAAADIKLKLISKYVPDLKSIEVSQDPENPIVDLSNGDLSDAINSLTAKLNELE